MSRACGSSGRDFTAAPRGVAMPPTLASPSQSAQESSPRRQQAEWQQQPSGDDRQGQQAGQWRASKLALIP